MRKKLQLLIFFGILVLLVTCEKDRDNENQKTNIGCFYQASANNQFNLGTSFLNTANDNQFFQEVSKQNIFWNLGYNVSVYVLLNDIPANAYSSPDKKIYYGYNLFYEIITYGLGDYAVDGVLAHEFAHQLQFKNNWYSSQSNLITELEADCFSGYYIAMNRDWNQSQMNGFFQQAYNSGNYMYNDPSFHGTPKQRFNAAKMGIEFGLAKKKGTYNWEYPSLHNAFKMNITNDILLNP